MWWCTRLFSVGLGGSSVLSALALAAPESSSRPLTGFFASAARAASFSAARCAACTLSCAKSVCAPKHRVRSAPRAHERQRRKQRGGASVLQRSPAAAKARLGGAHHLIVEHIGAERQRQLPEVPAGAGGAVLGRRKTHPATVARQNAAQRARHRALALAPGAWRVRRSRTEYWQSTERGAPPRWA